MYRLIPVLLLFSIASCSQPSPYQVDKRDSLMRLYFSVVDSINGFDTLSEDFKLLKAYYKNDTGFLKERYRKLSEWERYTKQSDPKTQCTFIPEVYGGKYDDAYRFYYSAAFCDTSILYIIGRKDTVVTADCYLFHDLNEAVHCKPVHHQSLLLTLNDWSKFVDTLYYIDFWGMKQDNGWAGFDGSSIWLSGYQKDDQTKDSKYKSIYRWSAEETALGKLFEKMVARSNLKVHCFSFE